MKKLLCLMMAVCLIAAMTACTAANKEEPENDVPKSEQEGTAGSNIALKDNPEEAEKQIKIGAVGFDVRFQPGEHRLIVLARRIIYVVHIAVVEL